MKSIIKPAKLVLLPSMLVALLAMSACNDTSTSTTDNDISAATSMEAVTPIDSNANTADPMTAEQTMSDNLSRYRWTLSTAMDSSNQPISALMAIKDQVTLQFNEQQSQNTISYSVGCNTIGAMYQLQGQTLKTQEGMSTKMSCGDLDGVENSLNELMQGDSTLSLVEGDSPQLTQVTDDATTLVWVGKMTAQAKYNGKGETVFWAVSADSKPCVDNKAQVCLQIMPLTYDDQGIKTSEGKPVEFAGVIDGYQHDGTHDEVLRLQRFKTGVDTVLVDNVDSEYAYVLDAVIERSAVK